MLDGAQIRNISDVAAYRASEEGLVPLTLWKREDIPHIPFLGYYVPAGYRPATFDDLDPGIDRSLFYQPYGLDEVWVECGGWGSDPTDAFMATGQYWAIVESGEFQTYARCYVQDPYASAQGLPSEMSVTCEHCGTVHNEFEECDGWDDGEEFDDSDSESYL